MKRHDYLKYALTLQLPNNLAWVISAFCLTAEPHQAYKQDPYEGRLVKGPSKYSYLQLNGELKEIVDSDSSQPLFTFKEPIKVGPKQGWMGNIFEDVECTIGNLIFNAIAIWPSFGSKYPFIAGKLKVSDMENYIAKRLTDTPKDNEPRDHAKIYVDEYLHFRDSLIYIEQFAPFVSWSATPKGITAPTGIKQFRKELLKEYEGRLNDPSIFAEYETRLKDFAKDYLKDDPAYGTFLSGKVLDISYKKAFLAIGIPDRLDPKSPIVPITRTLEEGQPTDPIQLAASLNGARNGSYSRGSETTNGGVVSKSVIRVGNSFKVDMEDCGTVLGVRKTYYPDSIKELIGRHLVQKGQLVYVENLEQAQHYVGQLVIVRSPAYCQAGPGDRLCKICGGKAFSQFPEGIIIPLAEVSHLILTQSLKSMHGKVLSTAEVDIDTAIS